MRFEEKFGDVHYARSFTDKLVGLMMKSGISDDHVLVFENCSSVHSHFMKFPIDVIYMDRDGVVLGIEELVPWKLGKAPKGAKHVAECNVSQAEKHGIRCGDVYEVRP